MARLTHTEYGCCYYCCMCFGDGHCCYCKIDCSRVMELTNSFVVNKSDELLTKMMTLWGIITHHINNLPGESDCSS